MRDTSALYMLVVRYHVSKTWPAALPVVRFSTTYDARHAPVTSMTLCVADQAELVGILVNLHGQGMQLESVARLDDTAG